MEGLQRFKQSWISVMILKAGVSLGQVVTLVVLLALASALPSPLYASKKQSEPSDACPRPQLFQAWMGVNAFRLTTCWAMSCWMCVRKRRAERRRQDEEEQHAVQAQRDNHVLARAHRLPTSTTLASQVPSLSSTVTSASFTTLAGFSSDQHLTPTPSTICTSHMASQQTLDHFGSQSDPDYMASQAKTRPEGDVRPNPTHQPVTPSTALEQTAETSGTAREALEQAPPEGNQEPPVVSTWATRMDRLAPVISKTMGCLAFSLFVCGNVLLFYPAPTSRKPTCYHAAPMLWWGTMTVVGVGWFLLLQMLFVALIVTAGGAVIVLGLQRLGVLPPSPTPEPPRPPRPSPLTPAEVARLRLVIFLPFPDSSRAESSTTSDTASPRIDPNRLAYPGIYLRDEQTTCAVCQESFAPPQAVLGIAVSGEPLRQLPCEHVYHRDCIDEWLLRGSGSCPACNRPVKEVVGEKGQLSVHETHVASSRWRLGSGSRAM